jgi:hypothetical protein
LLFPKRRPTRLKVQRRRCRHGQGPRHAIALAPLENFRRDSDLFGEGARNPEAQRRFQAALKRGFQTRDAEMDLAGLLGGLDDD